MLKLPMPYREKNNRKQWRLHKRLKTAMTKKCKRGRERKQAKWMIGRIGIQKARETPKEFET